jgi:hypothetical protein
MASSQVQVVWLYKAMTQNYQFLVITYIILFM